MSSQPSTAQADLAFLKAIAEGGGRQQMLFGAAYMLAGLLYGTQSLVQWAEFAGVIDPPPLGSLAIVSVPTILLVAIIAWLTIRTRKRGSSGVASRAIDAVFEATGLANLALILVIAFIAIRLQNFTFWLLYACVIFAIQGLAWYVAYKLRRRLWMLAVALGWLVTTLVMGWAIGTGSLHVFIAAAVVSLYGLMALPGGVMLHLARRSAS